MTVEELVRHIASPDHNRDVSASLHFPVKKTIQLVLAGGRVTEQGIHFWIDLLEKYQKNGTAIKRIRPGERILSFTKRIFSQIQSRECPMRSCRRGRSRRRTPRTESTTTICHLLRGWKTPMRMVRKNICFILNRRSSVAGNDRNSVGDVGTRLHRQG